MKLVVAGSRKSADLNFAIFYQDKQRVAPIAIAIQLDRLFVGSGNRGDAMFAKRQLVGILLLDRPSADVFSEFIDLFRATYAATNVPLNRDWLKANIGDQLQPSDGLERSPGTDPTSQSTQTS